MINNDKIEISDNTMHCLLHIFKKNSDSEDTNDRTVNAIWIKRARRF